MLLQELRDAQRILVLPRHAHRQRLQAADQHPRRMRVHAIAQRRPRLPYLVHQFLPAAHHSAGQVRMSAQILRAGMHHQIDAVLRRMLVDGRAKRAVDHADQLVLPGQRRRFLHVDHPQRRIRRRLQIQHPRIRPDRPRVLFEVVGIDKRRFNPHSGQPLREELRYPAVDVALRDDVISRLQECQDRGRDRSHAGSKRERRLHALKRPPRPARPPCSSDSPTACSSGRSWSRAAARRCP